MFSVSYCEQHIGLSKFANHCILLLFTRYTVSYLGTGVVDKVEPAATCMMTSVKSTGFGLTWQISYCVRLALVYQFNKSCAAFIQDDFTWSQEVSEHVSTTNQVLFTWICIDTMLSTYAVHIKTFFQVWWKKT